MSKSDSIFALNWIVGMTAFFVLLVSISNDLLFGIAFVIGFYVFGRIFIWYAYKNEHK